MIKAIITDLDGTLLRDDGTVSPQTKQVIHRIKDMGVRFVVATGRSQHIVRDLVPELGTDVLFITSNGSSIGYPVSRQVLYESTLSESLASTVLQYCHTHKLTYMVYKQDAIYSIPNLRSDYFLAKNQSLDTKYQSQFVLLSHEQPYQDYHGIEKILIIEQDHNQYNLIKQDLEGLDDIQLTASHQTYLDVNPKGVSKGVAVQELLKQWSIDHAEAIAFGDQENDLSMLQSVGHSVAMDNAIDVVKNVADATTCSNNEDGVAKYLKSYFNLG